MSYDFEKYRDKREKVLGVRKRGLSFGAMVSILAAVIMLGLGGVVIPKSLAFFQSRNLDDVIYKLQDGSNWQEATLSQLRHQHGVRKVATDTNGSRIVITFDRGLITPERFASLFTSLDLEAIMLNRVSHSQRVHTMKEEAAFEAL